MRKLEYKLDRKALEIIYLSFIRQILEYAGIIRDNCTQYEQNEIEKVKVEAGKMDGWIFYLETLNPKRAYSV